MIQTFIVEGRLPGYNELHQSSWQKSARIKNAAMDTAIMYALQVKPITEPVQIRLSCYEPNAKRDPDNVISGASKVILDMLQKYGKLPNDNRRWVRLVFDPVEVDREHPRIEVEITER